MGRWSANITMWNVRLANPGTLSKVDLAKMDTAFAGMQENVSHLIAAGEKERWSSNLALWQAMLGRM